MLNRGRYFALLSVLTLVTIVQTTNASDKYNVDVREYTWDPILRTYDIEIRHEREPRFSITDSLRAVKPRPLEQSPLGGRLLGDIFTEQSRKQAETNYLNAKAELIRFQLAQARGATAPTPTRTHFYPSQLTWRNLVAKEIVRARGFPKQERRPVDSGFPFRTLLGIGGVACIVMAILTY